MARMSLVIKCPNCECEVLVRGTGYGGSIGSYFDPPEGPELHEVTEILFHDCDCDLEHVELESGNKERLDTLVAREFWLEVDMRIDSAEIEVEVEPYEPDLDP